MNFDLFLSNFDVKLICDGKANTFLKDIIKDEKQLYFSIGKIYSLFLNNKIIEGFKILLHFLE